MISIVGYGIADPEDLEPYRALPAFRKATRQMLWATASMAKALSGVDLTRIRMGLVLGSSYGELDVTKDFLKSLTLEKMARPLLFQNSLHNATVGHLAQHWKIEHPTMTVSHRYFTAEKAIEVAGSLIESGDVDHCLVVCVDTLVKDWIEGTRKAYPEGTQLSEGSAAILLAGPNTPLAIQGYITSISYRNEVDRPTGPFYDSNGLQEFLAAFSNHLKSAPVTLHKPNCTTSVIVWKEAT